ncbi:MAG: tripartite tricarboxylate transporter TctB family protein [Spirochaetales bacterium]|nr:tripartite tricarboxylate transporter TctB family protein [Spirochaetales bacterium]
MFELIANILLLVFMVYSMFTHVLEAKIPKTYMRNPSNLMPDVWPKAIITLLCICLVINIIKIIKKNKGNPEFTISSFLKNSAGFFKSKMLIGMIIIAIASLIIETVGFVVTAILVLFSYGFLLGEKKLVRLAIASVVIALFLHIVFSGLLDVTLPRGTVPFLRNFALFLENLI